MAVAPSTPNENWRNFHRDTGEIFRFAHADVVAEVQRGPIYFVASKAQSSTLDRQNADLIVDGDGVVDDGLAIINFVATKRDSILTPITLMFAGGYYYWRTSQTLINLTMLGQISRETSVYDSQFVFNGDSAVDYVQGNFGPASTIPGTRIFDFTNGGIRFEHISFHRVVTNIGTRKLALGNIGAVGCRNIVIRNCQFTTGSASGWDYIFQGSASLSTDEVYIEHVRNQTGTGTLHLITTAAVGGSLSYFEDFGPNMDSDQSFWTNSTFVRARPISDVATGTNVVMPTSAPTITLTSAHLLVGNVSNVATDVAVTGDITITNAGVVDVAKIRGVAVKAGLTTTDGFVLTYVAANSRLELVAAGSGTTFADNVFRIQDNGDATKQIAFEASGITTGNTRTFTVPNSDGTLAILTTAQTLDSKTLTTQKDITFDGSTRTITNAGAINLTTTGSNTLTITSGGTLAINGVTTNFTTTAATTFDLGGTVIITANANSLSINSALVGSGNTGLRIYNSSSSKLIIENTSTGVITMQTVTGAITIQGGTSSGGAVVVQSISSTLDLNGILNGVRIQGVPIEPSTAATTGQVLMYNASGRFVPAVDHIDSAFNIVDNGDATKKLAFEVSGVTTATTRTLTVPNSSGTILLTAMVSGDVTSMTTTGVTTISGFAAWSSYTPQVDQGVTTNIAKTVNYAKYTQIGKIVWGQTRLTMTGAGTAGSNVTLTLPVTAAAASGVNPQVGAGFYFDNSTGLNYRVLVRVNIANAKFEFQRADTNGATFGLGADPNIAVGNDNDIISFNYFYEVT